MALHDLRTTRPVDPCDCDDDTPAPSTAVSTREELEAFYTVRTILRTSVNCQRIVMRDCDNQCSVLLDSDPEKPICTFRFAGGSRSVLFHDETGPEAVEMATVNDLYDHTMRLRAIVVWLERASPPRKRVLDREIMA